MNECPNCKSQSLKKGEMVSDGYRYPARKFSPENQRFTLTPGGIKLVKDSYACLDCGLVWNFTDPEKLRKFIKKYCEYEPAPKRPAQITTVGLQTTKSENWLGIMVEAEFSLHR